MANFKNITDLPVAESAEGLNLIVEQDGAAKRVAADDVCKVKSVNGAMPDENGNVQIDTASSWNDLKDKPFYSETETYAMFENHTVSGGGEPSMINVTKRFDVGDAVEIVYNSNSYTTVVKASEEGLLYIGNVSIMGGGDNTGEPFFIAPAGENTLGVACINDATVSVYITTETVHKLDAKYLPNSVWTEEETHIIADNVIAVQNAGLLGYIGTFDFQFADSDVVTIICNGVTHVFDNISQYFHDNDNIYGWVFSADEI